MSKSAIEQADEIVGCSAMFATGGILDYALRETKDTYRRGAYSDWCAKNNANGVSMGMDLNDMAQAIVSHHAASKPKGDGLPEVHRISFAEHWSGRNGEIVFSFDPPIVDGNAAKALSEHIMCCLAPPVRRLLAAFEVVDGPYSSGVWFVVTKDGRIHTVNDIAYGAYVLTDVVCSLVPKGAK